jgi:hypothetical protein
MGSARYSAAGAEAYLDKILDGEQPAVQADGPGPETEDDGRVNPPQREPEPQEPEQATQPELPPEPEQEEPEAKKPADEEETFEITRRGQRVRIPKAKALELAQKGFDYESKMAELKANEAELRKDAKGWESYQSYRAWMRQNQPAAQAVANLLQYFEEKGRVPKMDLEGDGEPGTEAPPQWFRSWQEKNDLVQQELVKREREREIESRTQTILAAVRSQPVLKRLSDADRLAKRDDRAIKKLAAAMQADPSRDLFEVAEEVATEVSLDVETLNPAARTYVNDKVRDQQRFGRTERPGANAPEAPAAKPSEYSAKDLKDGTVRRGVLNFLNSIAEP